MSNNCCTNESGCNPCNTALTTKESVASWLDNLTYQLFGAVQKTIVNGRAVWSNVCSPNEQLDNLPRNTDEGFICYLIRIFETLGVYFGGIWNIATAYPTNAIVVDGYSFYVSLTSVPAGIAISNPIYWQLLLTAPAGPQGIQGPPGASGGGSAISYAVRTVTGDVTASNTDAVILCEPAAPMNVNLSPIASYDAGKWFTIETNANGGNTVTVNASLGQTINGSSTIALTAAGESVTFVSNNVSDWRIL